MGQQWWGRKGWRIRVWEDKQKRRLPPERLTEWLPQILTGLMSGSGQVCGLISLLELVSPRDIDSGKRDLQEAGKGNQKVNVSIRHENRTVRRNRHSHQTLWLTDILSPWRQAGHEDKLRPKGCVIDDRSESLKHLSVLDHCPLPSPLPPQVPATLIFSLKCCMGLTTGPLAPPLPYNLVSTQQSEEAY